MTKKVHDSYMAYKAKYDAWADLSETRLPQQDPEGLMCTLREKLAGGIDAFIDLVGRATSWLALGIALVMGAQRAAALRASRIGFDLGAGARVAHLGADLPVRHVLRAAARRARARRRAVPVFHAAQQASRRRGLGAHLRWRSALIVIWLSIPYVLAVLVDRRRHRQSRRHRLSLHRQVADPDRLRAPVPAVAVRGDQELPRDAESADAGTEILAILMLVSFFVLLMAGIPVALTLATVRLRVRLSRLRHACCSTCCRAASSAW